MDSISPMARVASPHDMTAILLLISTSVIGPTFGCSRNSARTPEDLERSFDAGGIIADQSLQLEHVFRVQNERSRSLKILGIR
jgi:hypothetical protein